jgi:AcrR family transcriptional regulator
MGDVARVAGVSRATMYNYFTDRDQLLDSVRDWASEQFNDEIRSAMLKENTLSDQMAAAAVVVLRYEKWRHAHVHPTDLRFESQTFTVASRAAVAALVATLEPFVKTALDSREAPTALNPQETAECLARLLFSLLATPGITFNSSRLKDTADFFARAVVGLFSA